MFLKNTILILILVLNVCNCWPNFYLYTRSNPTNAISVTNSLDKPFSNSLQTRFLIHGFGSSQRQPNINRIKDELVKKEYTNVIIVDWEEGAKSPNYLSAVKNAKECGKKVGDFIKNNNINPKFVHCIGHSLGAHACGFAGKVTKLRRISGMDPAGPGFKGQPVNNRLDRSDADVVDIIHSDVLLGIQDPIGHKDFYPNNGVNQPGCENNSNKITVDFISDRGTEVLSCSHSRAVDYFAESINSKCLFSSKICESYDQLDQCSCNSIFGCSRMGFFADKTRESGKFYLKTARMSPFCVA